MWKELCSELENDNDRVWKDDYISTFKQSFYKVRCKSWFKKENRGWFAGKMTTTELVEHNEAINRDIQAFKETCMTPHVNSGMYRIYCKKLNFPIWNEDGVMTTDEKLDLIIWQNKKNEAMRLADKFWDNEIAKKKAIKKKRVIYDDSFFDRQAKRRQEMEQDDRIQRLERQNNGCPGNLDYC